MKLTNRMLAAAACAIAASAFASTANATVYTLDLNNSTISLNKTFDVCAACDLDANFSQTGDLTWDSSVDNPKRFDNFIDWTVSGLIGSEKYDVSVDLHFTAPDPASGSASGSAGYATLLGVISAGKLTWDSAGTVNFIDSTLSFLLDSTLEGGFGNSTTTGVTFNATDVAPIPLPAAGLLLLGGIGVLGAVRRRGRAEA